MSLGRRRMNRCAGRGIAEAQQHPPSRRKSGGQPAIAIHLTGEIDHLVQRNARRAVKLGTGHGLRGLDDLLRQVFDAFCGRRYREHRDVAIEAEFCRRLSQFERQGTAFRLRLAPHDPLHCPLRRYPGPAAARPSSAVRDGDFEIELSRRLDGVLQVLVPVVRPVAHWPFRQVHFHVQNLCACDAHALHVLEVCADAFPGHVSIDPMPPYKWPGLPGRYRNARLQRAARRGEWTCVRSHGSDRSEEKNCAEPKSLHPRPGPANCKRSGCACSARIFQASREVSLAVPPRRDSNP